MAYTEGTRPSQEDTHKLTNQITTYFGTGNVK